jgi:glucokinase
MVILAADLGGTQSRLLLAERQAGDWRPLRQATLPSRNYPGIAALLQDFLQDGESPTSACIAAAGPVADGQLQMSNLPWLLDSEAISRQFGIHRLHLLNDFAAQAHALPHLQPGQLCTLQPGKPQANGLRALMGAGTGLGMAMLSGSAAQARVIASQGGHADFAPGDEQQIELLRYLRHSHARVSLEMLLSGAGLRRIYAFLGALPTPTNDLPDAHAISLAAAGGEVLAGQALQLFARLYGAAAGNLALTCLPYGGLYLSGGIAPKMLPYLQHPDVLAAFANRPPMQQVLASIPLHVVLDEHIGLHGALQVATQLECVEGRQA